jgi:hypothetical protein
MVLITAPSAFKAASTFAKLAVVWLVDAVNFPNFDAYRDFIFGLEAARWRDGGGAWPGLSATYTNEMNRALKEAQASGETGYAAAMQARDALSAGAKEVSEYQKFDLGVGGRSVGQDQRYRASMYRLKKLIETLPEQLRQAAAESNKLEASKAKDTVKASSSYVWKPSGPTGGGGFAPGSSSSAMTGAAGPSPVLMGAAAVALIGVGFLVVRKLKRG